MRELAPECAFMNEHNQIPIHISITQKCIHSYMHKTNRAIFDISPWHADTNKASSLTPHNIVFFPETPQGY